MKKKNKFPNIKKELKDFLLSEEGKISSKDIAKIGMSLAVMSMLSKPDIASGQTTICEVPPTDCTTGTTHNSIGSAHTNSPYAHSSGFFYTDTTGATGHNSTTGVNHTNYVGNPSHISCCEPPAAPPTPPPE